MDIITNDGALEISTGLGAEAFSRTNMVTALEEQGVIVSLGKGYAEYTPYRFTGTKPADGGIIHCKGDFFAGKTLAAVLSGADGAYRTRALSLAIGALTALIENPPERAPGAVGAGGIVVDTEHDEVLFAPAHLFERCAANEQAHYAGLQGWYVNKGLSGTEALIFTRAAVAYRALCGEPPFPALDTTARQTDIYDAAFAPPAFLVNGLSAELSAAIDAGLRVRMKEESRPGEKRFKDEKGESKRRACLARARTFSTEQFAAELAAPTESHTMEIPPAEFTARLKKFRAGQRRALTVRRFLRRNRTALIAGFLAAILAVWGGTGYYRTNQKLPTTRGLSGAETAAALYTLVHRADVPGLQQVAKGRGVKALINTVSAFFVSIRERQAYDQAAGTVPPEEWVFFKTDSKFWMYGLTNLSVDGKPVPLALTLPQRRDKPAPFMGADGIPPAKGSTEQHTADYFLVYTDSGQVNVQHETAVVTLVWNGTRWIVRAVGSTGSGSETAVRDKKFREGFQRALDANGGAVLQAVDSLRGEYPWLPAVHDIQSGAHRLADEFGSESARAVLGEGGN